MTTNVEPAAQAIPPDTISHERVAKNAVIYGVAQLLSWCVSFFSISLIPRYLGETATGQLAIAGVAVGTVSNAVGFSVEQYLVAEIGRAPGQTERVLRAALGLRLTCIPIMVLGAILMLFATHSTHIIWVLGALSIVGCATNYISDPLRSTLAGWEDAKRVALLDFALVFGSLVQIPFVIFGPIGLTIVGLCVTLVVFAFRMYYVRKHIVLTPLVDFTLWKQIFLGSASFYVVNVVLALYVFTSTFVLKHFTNEASVGVYTQAIRLQGTFLFIPTALGTALLPSLTRLADVSATEFKEMQKRVLALMFVLGLPVATLVFILAEPLCRILYGTKAFTGLPQVLQVCAFNLLPLYISSILYNFLIAQRKNAVWSIFLLMTVGINYISSLILVPWALAHRMNGAVGSVASLVIAEVFTTIMALIVLRNNPIDRVVLGRMFRTLIPCTLMAGVMLSTRQYFILIPLILGLAAFIIPAKYLHILGADEQRKLEEVVRRKLRLRRKE
jgi:O-antigen/teichoic acid export membrane protein